MKFLIDANLSPRLVGKFHDAGHDAVHVTAIGMGHATDTEIIDAADRDGQVIISADTDFGTVLAMTQRRRPSVLLLRLTSPRRTDQLADLMLANLPGVIEALIAGAVVVVEDDRVRIRTLPLR